MSKNWIRHFKCTLSGKGSSIDVSELRVTFKIPCPPNGTPATAEVTIYNLSEKSARKIVDKQNEMTDIEIEAGYKDSTGVIFKGQIRQATYGRESPTDTIVWLNCSAEFGSNDAIASKTFDENSTQKDHFDHAMEKLKEGGADKGEIHPDLEKLKFPQPVTLFGMARDVIRNIALSNDCHWFIDPTNGEIHILELKKPLKNQERKLDSATGMIGMPTQTLDGVIVKALIDPKFRLGGKVIIDEKSIQKMRYPLNPSGDSSEAQYKGVNDLATDGEYKIMKLDWTGDTRGQAWYADMLCMGLDEKGSPTGAGGSETYKYYSNTE